MKHQTLFIDGQWKTSGSGKYFEVINPATEEAISYVSDADKNDIDQALKAAEKARKNWQKIGYDGRAPFLKKLMGKILENKERLAEILVREQGKTYETALGEVDGTVAYIENALEITRNITSDLAQSPTDEMVIIKKVPYGVVVALCAWNYPLALAGRKLGPALITGNTMVLKPHELTPLATVELFKLIEEVGFPPGVINLITGDGPTVGSRLVASPVTKMVTVTGSIRAGQAIYKTAAPNIANLCLELGGKAPFIVLEDADLVKAAEAAALSRFINCGQICVCADMVFVQESIAEEFTEKLIAATKKLKMGDPFSSDSFMGPKASKGEVDKMDEIVQKSISEGAVAVLGGKKPQGKEFQKGYWYEPTILTGVKPGMTAAEEEIFGPVFPVLKIRDLDEAIEIANKTPYGLAAYLFTGDMKKYIYASEFLEVGTLYHNQGIMGYTHVLHAGQKQSGLGGEDGIYGVEGYLQKRVLYMKF